MYNKYQQFEPSKQQSHEVFCDKDFKGENASKAIKQLNKELKHLNKQINRTNKRKHNINQPIRKKSDG